MSDDIDPDRKFSNGTDWDNSIDWDDASDGSDGGYDRHGSRINANAMKELVQLRMETTRLRADLAAVTEERDRMREALEESRQSWERVDKAHSFRVHESEMRLIKIFDIEKENARLRDALKPFAAMMDAEHMPSLVKALDSDWTRCIVKIGDLRRARAAIEGVKEPVATLKEPDKHLNLRNAECLPSTVAVIKSEPPR